MNDEIQTFVEFLLDTETTSETLFSEAITEKQELFNNVRNGSIFEKIVDQKLRQWKSYYQKEQSAIADRIAINAGNETSDEGSENESEQELSSDNDDENTSQLQMHKQDQTFQSIKQSDILIDPISQCNRLLQFLYYCQQNHIHLTDLYFCTLDHCVKSENEKIGGIALQQIALHLSDDIHDEKECQRLIKCLPSNLSSPTIPEIYKPILKTIQTLISRNKTKQDVSTVMSSSDLDILYPYKARFLDLHREFRDSTHYFIDGDSLILSVAHHINIDLLTYYGNTLHVIFIIERILLTLFNQTQQCNYTLLFFDSHYQFYTYFTLYGKSLTTRDVRDNQLQIILPTALMNEEINTDRKDSASGDKKKQKAKGQSKKVYQKKAEKIIEENKQRKINKCIINETDQIVHVEDLLKQIPFDNYSAAMEIIDGSLSKFKTSVNRLELLKRKFHLQRQYLQTLRKKNILTNEEKSKLDYLQTDYFATMTEMAHLENSIDVFSEKKKYMEELINDLPFDQEKWYRFQMEKINSRLPRYEQGIPDSRVPDFIPDNWQIQFLDAVDKRQSIIIVAPTASGKTYASYYAMNKVLKDRDDPNGICVYIAPTKALVNQVAATIHYKFGAVFGIFTRDYRTNMDGCRILVTIPQCMQILLLSPNHQRWCQRIKYAIFDEIHSTVSNGNELCDWIENIENQRSKLFKTSKPRRVCFISHPERIADLNKYLYSNRQLYPIHPIGLMNTKQLITRGVPKDFSLSPYETLQLNDAMNTLSISKM
ncbi:unnamed protein product [Rotaria sp. Silwood2]|nr:unnamed protein product [Rotaria sp. Silwood2]